MKTLTKNELLQYLNIVGLDESEFKGNLNKKVTLTCIQSFYEKMGANKLLPQSSKDLSLAYEILLAIINDDFWYTDEEQKKAYDNVLKLLNELTRFKVSNNSNPEINFERTTNLIKSVIVGLSSCGDINRFMFYKENASPSNNLHFGNKIYEDASDELKILYLLLAYSEFEDTGKGYLMFDENNEISFEKLRNIIDENLKDRVPLKKQDEDLVKHKKLVFSRPSLKQLRESK